LRLLRIRIGGSCTYRMKNIMLPCNCKLKWDEKELELIMCNDHSNEYIDYGFTIPAEEFIKNVASPKGSHYSSKMLASLK
jgi:hypothetical protein